MFRYDRLDALVSETGKKKNYLSARMGHSGRYLNDAKKQNIQIKPADVEILAQELGTTPEYLYGETDKKEEPLTVNGEELSAKELALKFVDDLAAEGDEQALWEIFERLSQKMQKK